MKTLKSDHALHKLLLVFLATLVFIVFISSAFFFQVFAQEPSDDEPQFFMGIMILESQQQAILDGIKKVKELQLGNMVILHPMDQAWNLTLIEEAIREADNLGLYTIFETYNFSDHKIRISPNQFASWQTQYPHLLGIVVQEITGKQVDMNLWLDNSTGAIKTRLEAEKAIIENITSSMQLAEFKHKGAKIMLQENVVSYASANTSYCDVLITKVFNAPNTELMIGLTRGIANSYNIPAWGLWVDTWREWTKPPAFTPEEVESALYEGWFYGAKFFFFEQGNFFGTLSRDWPNKHIILASDGKLTEYGRVIQRFYAFLQNQNSIEYNQPNYKSSIAVMIGQSGWSSRGKDWGLWDQSERQGDFDYRLLNLFFPGIGDNWQIGSPLTGKEFTGLPFGMVDIISIYASPSVMKQYTVIIALGWSQLTDAIASNIEEYVTDGGIFFALLTFTHGNTVDNLEDPYAWATSFISLFGVQVNPSVDNNDNSLDVEVDTFLHNVTFTQNTFWYPWSGRIYDFIDLNGTGSWFWKFNITLSDNENTKVLAWVDGIQTETNAFIIENKKGSGYTYIVNTRNPNSLPDGVLNKALRDFIYALCAYQLRPMTYVSYPQEEYWLSQGQKDRVIYLIHDNQTSTEHFTYHIKPQKADLTTDKTYMVFDYFNSELPDFSHGSIFQLDVTLQADEKKLFLLFEDNGEPKVLSSDTILSKAPLFDEQQLFIYHKGVEESANVTTIYYSTFERPQYILGTPFDLTSDYELNNNILSIVSESNIIIGWENTTDVSVIASSVPLTNVTWNSSLGTLAITTNGTVGQNASILVYSRENTPYYLKVDGKKTSEWSYDNSTGLVSTNFRSTGDTVELVLGFKPILIDKTFVSDERADVGSTQEIGFHVVWMSDGSDVEDAVVYVNGTTYLTNRTGWVTFDVSNDKIGKVVWTITRIELGGSTVYAKTVNDPFIIWDRLNVVDSSYFDGLIQEGSPKSLWLKTEYEYDSTVFDGSKGTIILNGLPMTWSNQNMRWEHVVTSYSLGKQSYDVTSVKDELFGLTSVNNKDIEISIIWDKLELTKTELTTSALGITNLTIYVTYSYSQSPVDDATVSVNGILCNKIGSGMYSCAIDGWSPIQYFIVKAESASFNQTIQNVFGVHILNTILYVILGLSIMILTVFFVLKRKQHLQKRES